MQPFLVRSWFSWTSCVRPFANLMATWLTVVLPVSPVSLIDWSWRGRANVSVSRPFQLIFVSFAVWFIVVGLTGYGNRQTHHLSGGQQQRVALARSLVLEPKILLLDEPFASLDQHLRERLREEVRDIQQRLKITTLFVTHGQDEALSMADRIVVLHDGRMEQVAAPDMLYREPETPFVAGFIGTMNLIEGNVNGGTFSRPGFSHKLPAGDGPAIFAVRPEALAITPATGAGAARVHRVTDYGTHGLVDLELKDGLRLKSMVPEARDWKAGQPVDIAPRAFAAYRDDAVLYRSSAAQ